MSLSYKKFIALLIVLVLTYAGAFIFSWEHARNQLKQSLATISACIKSTYHYEYPPNQPRIYVQGNTEKCNKFLPGFIGHGFLYLPEYKHEDPLLH